MSGRNTGTPASASTVYSFFSHRAAVRSAAQRSTVVGNRVVLFIKSSITARELGKTARSLKAARERGAGIR